LAGLLVAFTFLLLLVLHVPGDGKAGILPDDGHAGEDGAVYERGGVGDEEAVRRTS